MRPENKPKQVWVSPAYRKLLRTEAADKDMSIMALTQKIAEEWQTDLEKRRKERDEKKFLFKI